MNTKYTIGLLLAVAAALLIGAAWASPGANQVVAKQPVHFVGFDPTSDPPNQVYSVTVITDYPGGPLLILNTAVRESMDKGVVQGYSSQQLKPGSKETVNFGGEFVPAVPWDQIESDEQIQFTCEKE